MYTSLDILRWSTRTSRSKIRARLVLGESTAAGNAARLRDRDERRRGRDVAGARAEACGGAAVGLAAGAAVRALDRDGAFDDGEADGGVGGGARDGREVMGLIALADVHADDDDDEEEDDII